MYTKFASRQQPERLPRSPSSVYMRAGLDAACAGQQSLQGSECEGQQVLDSVSYPYPAQSPNGALNQASVHISRTFMEEHMLRRKTPNGTLAAGYDGRPTDWAGKRPANKHFLAPALKAAGDAAFQPCPDKVKASSPFVRQSASIHVGEHSIGSLYNHYGALPQRLAISSLGSNTQKQEKIEANPILSSGLDSVLYQGSPFHQLNHYTGQPLKMAMQPIWPPFAGITSLNSPGPYGPYWPNGAFVPYRPAPLRDPRFDTGASLYVYNSGPQDSESGCKRSCRRSYDGFTPCTLATSSPSSRSAAMQVSDCENLMAVVTDLSGHEAAHSPRGGAPKMLRDGSIQTTQLNQQPAFPRIAETRPPPYAPAAAFQGSPNQYHIGAEINNFRFREKVLIWAHRVYIRLLSLRQQARRTVPNVQYYSDRCPPASVLPHHPQRSSLDTQNSAGMAHEEQQSRYFRSSATPDQPSQRDSLGKAHVPVCSIDCSRALNVATVYYKHGRFLDGQDTGLYLGSNPHNSNLNPRSRAIAAQGNLLRLEPSPTNAAMTAIEMLSRLCQESEWSWTDGMLLGGCLAYCLGDYDKALKWYTRVLTCDSDNVEANSNLAATLLSLERRQEAEEYWLRAVKLRPSYFEAVEHLVGMYCEDHQGKEAVELIDFVQRSLRTTHDRVTSKHGAQFTALKEISPNSPNAELTDRSPFVAGNTERLHRYDHNSDMVFGISGYAIPTSDNGRLLSLIHGKGNMLYALGDNIGAAIAFEDVILIGSAQRHLGIRSLIGQILEVFAKQTAWETRHNCDGHKNNRCTTAEPILLMPEVALETSRLVFPPHGNLPGLEDVPTNMAKRAGISIVSNSLLSLAKIYQDGMSSSGATATDPRAASGVQDILALYYLSLSLQPSPSTANNVGILLASVQQPATKRRNSHTLGTQVSAVPGIVPGSGIALALAYYNYGLNLDPRHAHLYTNLGSLFKDIGQLNAAIRMYEKAVNCDANFDIALANLANAVKDQGRISEAIEYYRRAVTANPDFAEAVCGLANALNSVCNWHGRGGVRNSSGHRDRWHVDEEGMLYDGIAASGHGSGWIERVVSIVDKQLRDGEDWGKGILQSAEFHYIFQQLHYFYSSPIKTDRLLSRTLQDWANKHWEGAKVVRIVERATKRLGWQVYRHRYIHEEPQQTIDMTRPQLPIALAVPTAPTVLPFHTFTCPLSAKQIRKISQRNGLRISCSTLRAPWLPRQIYGPPAPPNPHLNVGYVSSDFNNHPLAHLMQSVFGFHDVRRVRAVCYATTASDGSVHRQQIEREAPIFYDASSWSIDHLVSQIVDDNIHILVNLNGYTRGAKNEVFAARPAPLQMSFMGFAGTLGAEWCDYLLADKIAIPPQTLRPYRRNVDVIDQMDDGNNEDDESSWVYGENIIFTRDTFFCCDHRQSAPDARGPQLSWEEEQNRRWHMRKELFPSLPDDNIILGNFNQLYKAVLWLLRFPDLGEKNLRETAMAWVGAEVASRVIFTDVAPKHEHIARARVCDLFLDTPECNAHTTAADVLWSGTPLLTFPSLRKVIERDTTLSSRATRITKNAPLNWGQTWSIPAMADL
ncbi:MAG: hypothetical protein Q9219_002713 [cf. Caloplaca sp. 3 TL-2023]